MKTKITGDVFGIYSGNGTAEVVEKKEGWSMRVVGNEISIIAPGTIELTPWEVNDLFGVIRAYIEHDDQRVE